MPVQRTVLAAVLLCLMLSACTMNATDLLPALVQSGSPSSPNSQPVLRWQGYGLWGDGDITACKFMEVDASSHVTYGLCDGPAASSQSAHQEILEMVARIAPFEYTTGDDKLVFHGQGQLKSVAWQHAVLAWVHQTYSEAASGRACSSCHTVLSWYVGQVPNQPDMCKHLTVLNYGYAYAGIVPCAGGQIQTSTGSWLETSEWEQLDSWMSSRSATYQNNNYFEATGTQAMSEAEITQLEQLAQSIYARLMK